MTRIALAAAFLAALGSSAAAQQAPTLTIPAARQGLGVDEFIAWVGSHLDRPVMYAPPARQASQRRGQTICFDREVRIARHDLLEFALRTLIPFDLTMIRVGEGDASYYLVENLQSPTLLRYRAPYVTEAELEKTRHQYTLVTCTVRLQHASVLQLQSQIQRLSPPARPCGAAIIPLPSENAVVLIDFAPKVADLVKMLHALDVEAKRPPLLDPWKLEAKLKRLGGEIAALRAEIAKLKAGR